MGLGSPCKGEHSQLRRAHKPQRQLGYPATMCAMPIEAAQTCFEPAEVAAPGFQYGSTGSQTASAVEEVQARL